MSSKQEKVEIETTPTKENSSEESSTMDSDNECDGVLDDCSIPFRFIFGEEAQKNSLDGIAYGLRENGLYFVIGKDGSEYTGLLVDALIRRNIKSGILSPIASISKSKGTEATQQKDEK